MSVFGKNDQEGGVQQSEDEGGLENEEEEEDTENHPPDPAPPSQGVSKLKTFFWGSWLYYFRGP